MMRCCFYKLSMVWMQYFLSINDGHCHIGTYVYWAYRSCWVLVLMYHRLLKHGHHVLHHLGLSICLLLQWIHHLCESQGRLLWFLFNVFNLFFLGRSLFTSARHVGLDENSTINFNEYENTFCYEVCLSCELMAICL